MFTTSQDVSFDMFFDEYKIEPRLKTHLTKVYTILGLFVSIFLGTLYLSQKSSDYLLLSSPWIISIIQIGLIFWLSASRNPTTKLMLVLSVSYLSACIVAPLTQASAIIDPQIFKSATMYSLALFVSLSMTAFLCGKRSFLFLGSILSYGLFGLFIMSFFGTGSITLYLGFFVFCGLILYETQVIIFRFETTGESDCYRDAMQLGMNFVNIFIRIMVILMKNKMENKKRKNKEEE